MPLDRRIPTIYCPGARVPDIATPEMNFMYRDRIRKERRTLGLDRSDFGTTADVMARSIKQVAAPKARDNWLPAERGPLMRPLPRVGATSFKYGEFHVSHQDYVQPQNLSLKRIASAPLAVTADMVPPTNDEVAFHGMASRIQALERQFDGFRADLYGKTRCGC
eukprot:TRINITY_DN22735_c6_g1_i1.p1 TRINITY_DN22735_c6_g1~~TRINITY_DN22735_c6_g1_i1.p1  ORF type:complete len:164 (+),score=24.11 TRINITY_DN22735_c6_g1_i1:76-567(+)